jgi:tRNA A37 threonylcarbamoyladenosine modification protein TsaB
MPRVRLLSDEVVRPSAASVARLGAERLARGETVDLAEFEPFYLKEFVAKMPAKSAFAKLPF